MTIYDVKFYGVYFVSEDKFCGANLCVEKKHVHEVPGFKNLFFEVSVLEAYEGREQVLKIEFEDGLCAYQMYNAPFAIFVDDMWKKCKDKTIPEAFMSLYIRTLMNNQ